MKTYRQLTDVQRYQIEALKKAKKDQKDMAAIIGVSASTVCRELKHNSGQRGYRPKQAQNKAVRRRVEATQATKMVVAVVGLIEAKIRLDWSPEQVSGWLSEEQAITISHERIYQYVWRDKRRGGELYKHLRQAAKSEKSNTDQKISAARLETESALMSGVESSNKRPA